MLAHMSRIHAFMRVALSFLLMFCLVAPCPCDAPQADDNVEVEAHSCCPSASDDAVADRELPHGHDESECSHCGDDVFVGADSVDGSDVAHVGSAAGPPATTAAPVLVGRLWGEVLVVVHAHAPPPQHTLTDPTSHPLPGLRGPDPRNLNVIRC